LAKIPIILGEVDEEKAPRLLDAIAGSFGYQETDINGDPNPETKAQYARRKMRKWAMGRARRYELQQAIDEIVIEEIEIT